MKRRSRVFLRRRFFLGRGLCISGFAVSISGGRLCLSTGFFRGSRLTVRICCRFLVFSGQGERGDCRERRVFRLGLGPVLSGGMIFTVRNSGIRPCASGFCRGGRFMLLSAGVPERSVLRGLRLFLRRRGFLRLFRRLRVGFRKEDGPEPVHEGAPGFSILCGRCSSVRGGLLSFPEGHDRSLAPVTGEEGIACGRRLHGADDGAARAVSGRVRELHGGGDGTRTGKDEGDAGFLP